MRIDTTTAAGSAQRNDADYDFPTGIYTCRLDDVVEIAHKADDERKTPRLVFEFSVADGPYRGKKLSTFVRKNLFAGVQGKGNASSLYKLAKSLGVADPMLGFDTTQFVGKLFTIMAKNEGTRAWPESIIQAAVQSPTGPVPPPVAPPTSPQAGRSAPPKPPVAPPGPPPAPKQPAPGSRWQWADADGKWYAGTASECESWMVTGNHMACDTWVMPEGAPEDQMKTAESFGFQGAIPF
ncbi:hypothetical protein [Fimbriiglobus ruber]|uniref:DUF669 domain-containing protein n=1 Tax=Fimbriiglobus ruber TaxID=1908690 RepID=A0A225DB44_9BACT|nr:hypothetical protein [Fimbriiglobus ruber]OWK34359.1 hypothetical protein FRUB_10330 [Fimbriiglobus ruber]